MGLISRVSSRTYRRFSVYIPILLTLCLSYSRSRSRSASRERSPPRRERSRSNDRGDNDQKFGSKPGSFPPSNDLHSVLVSDLPQDMTKREMEEMFDKYGKIGDIFLPRHRDHGRGRGFGFVRFYEKRAQEDCVDDAKKKGFRCDGKDLRVDYAHTRPAVGSRPRDDGGRRGGYDDRRGGGYNDRRGGGDRYGGGGYRGGNDRFGGRDDRRGGYNDRRRDRSRSNERRGRY